ncbi:MAG: hypothetical protein COT73_06780 [Bdellovibrio sp. CG10_big_fil_rev_8_21_14_0_10_47_8]|nr:MAG: hypothetical protein COT73_06780 [Bdellovibrio sp. CG10_big_fil_rev_8_21_14_0_10_47_8]
MILLKIRRASLLTGLAFASAIAGSLALVQGVSEIGMIYDRQGFFSWTGVLLASMATLVLAVAIFSYALTRKNWLEDDPAVKDIAAGHHRPSPLEEALTLLVMEFIKDHEAKRMAATEKRHAPEGAEGNPPLRKQNIPSFNSPMN